MTVNVERLLKLAEVIESEPDHFDMENVIGTPYPGNPQKRHGISCMPLLIGEVSPLDCGYACCMAGWALYLWGAEISPEAIKGWTDGTWSSVAAGILGLTGDEAYVLFNSFGLDAMSAGQLLRDIAAGAPVPLETIDE